MRFSNCLIFALSRRIRFGGHLIERRSHWGAWSHWAWSADLITFEEFVPIAEKRKHRIPPLLFRGHVRTWRPAADAWDR